MNRREAVKLLTSIPGLATIQRADLEPDDVLVLKVQGPISQDTARRLTELCEQVWPGHKAVVIDHNIDLSVIRKA